MTERTEVAEISDRNIDNLTKFPRMYTDDIESFLVINWGYSEWLLVGFKFECELISNVIE